MKYKSNLSGTIVWFRPHGHRELPAVVLQSGWGGDARHLVGDVRHGLGGRGADGVQGAGSWLLDGRGEILFV